MNDGKGKEVSKAPGAERRGKNVKKSQSAETPVLDRTNQSMLSASADIGSPFGVPLLTGNQSPNLPLGGSDVWSPISSYAMNMPESNQTSRAVLTAQRSHPLREELPNCNGSQYGVPIQRKTSAGITASFDTGFAQTNADTAILNQNSILLSPAPTANGGPFAPQSFYSSNTTFPHSPSQVSFLSTPKSGCPDGHGGPVTPSIPPYHIMMPPNQENISIELVSKSY